MNAQTRRISGQIFTTPQSFQLLDTLIIQNSRFENIHGDALRLENIKIVRIEDCDFLDIANTVGTRAAVCGRQIEHVIIRQCRFKNILGTAIRFPIDGSSLLTQRIHKINIDSVEISYTKGNASQEGTGIRIFHCDSVFISRSSIRNTDYHGLFIGRNSSGQLQTDQEVKYLEIHENRIDSTLGDGIMAQENILASRVTHNIISNVAWNGIGAKPTEGDHGMYWQASGAIIEGNTIFMVRDGLVSGNPGSGISLRTNAQVNANLVHNCTGNGIGYFNDHPGKGTLRISNNVVYNNDRNGIYINGSNGNILQPDKVRHPDSVQIFHNTVINAPIQSLLHHSAPIALYLMTTHNEVCGNLLVFENIQDTTAYIRFLNSRGTDIKSWNFYSEDDPGFKDKRMGNFALNAESRAIDFLPSGLVYVRNDFTQMERIGMHDAGAFEYVSAVLDAHVQATTLPKVYPNPYSRQIRIHQVSAETPLILTNIQGQRLWKGDAGRINELSDIPSGMYVLQICGDVQTVIRLIKE